MKTVLITRPMEQAKQTARQLKSMGWHPLICPLYEIHHLSTVELDKPIDAYQGLIFTSQNAISPALKLFPSPNRSQLSCYVVGSQSSMKLQDMGFQIAACHLDAESLLQTLMQLQAEQQLATPLLYLRGVSITLDFTAALRNINVDIDEAIVYDTAPYQALPIETIAQSNAILFYSTKTAQLFVQLIRAHDRYRELTFGITAITISEKVAHALAPLHFRSILVAATPEEKAMLALLSKV